MTLKRSIGRCKRWLVLVTALANGCLAAQTSLEASSISSQLDTELFYEILVGEISVQSGDSNAGFALLLDAAKRANSNVLFERATQIALNARNGDAALQAARSWVLAFPNARDANRYLIQILIGLNRLQDVVAPIKRSLRTMSASDKFSIIESLPRYFARTVDRELAATSVEQALSGETNDAIFGALAWAAIGQMRLQANDRVGALAAAKRGFALNAQSVAPASLALALLDHANPEAEALLRLYLSDSPAPELRVAYIRHLVTVQRNLNAYEEALRLTQQAPNHTDGWLLRGSLEVQDRKFPQAQESLEKYIHLRAPAHQASEVQATDHSWNLAHLLLSQVAEESGHFVEALEYLRRVNTPSSDALRLGARQAAILAKQGKLEDGIALLRALPEDRADAAKNKLSAEIQLLQDNKKTQRAYRALEDALLRFPEDPDLKYDLGLMAEKAGKPDVMETLMRQVINAKPNFHAAYNALGYSFADRNIRLDEARQLISRALEHAPGDPFIVDSMAWLEYRSGNTQVAIKLLQSAFKTRPDAEIAAHLGEVLWSIGDKLQANAVWDQGLKINPDNETLLETTRRLRGGR